MACTPIRLFVLVIMSSIFSTYLYFQYDGTICDVFPIGSVIILNSLHNGSNLKGYNIYNVRNMFILPVILLYSVSS